MPRKAFTTEEFIQRIKDNGQNLIPLSPYINKRTKIKMKCLDCGHEWEVLPGHILNGSGCPKCVSKKVGESKRTSHEDFIKRIPENVEILNEYQGLQYDLHCKCKKCGYEWITKAANLEKSLGCPSCNNTLPVTEEKVLSEIETNSPTITVLEKWDNTKDHLHCKCNICQHEWDAHVVALRRGQRCPKCVKKENALKFAKSTEQFIKEANEIHNYAYDYSMVNYVNNKTKVTIICPIHGIFEQTPAAHLSGQGCPECVKIENGLKRRLSQDVFIKRCNDVHNNFYDYSKTIYTGKRNKVIVTCPIHGDFEQNAWDHMHGSCCPKCNQSRGERLISNFLDQHNIKYVVEKVMPFKINNRNVRVDFLLKLNNINYIIEYNGRQHYEPVDYFGGEEVFKLQCIRDNGLREICKNNNIHLIEIKYDLSIDQIKELLLKELNINN